MISDDDKLVQMFEMQESYMRLLAKIRSDFPQEWPIEPSVKANQLEMRDLIFNSMGELFEMIQELKNSKKHRQTEVKDMDRDKFLEEAVDAFKFFLEVMILVGVTPDEFFGAYVKKDQTNIERIKRGY